MSIPAQNSNSNTVSDQRLSTRRAYDIEQRAYAAVGRSFAAGSEARSRHLRIVFASVAVVTIMILIAMLAMLTQENISSPHALKIAAAGKAAPEPAKGKPVVIIDEKDDAPKRPVVASGPIPPLVLLTPAEARPAPAMVQARPAAVVKTSVKVRERGKLAAATLKHAALKAGKTAHPQAANSVAARKAARKTSAPAPVKRRVSASAAASPVQQARHADTGALDTLFSFASLPRRYLGQPVPVMASRQTLSRRHYLSKP
ncbi:hypothetical protein CR152_27135 [Massilia violaceinigra]|uniref:Uncharacterized protein n=1 Tax=Massilia violaceinigra TaxID=2045208 RepID=A0A2D2DS17_9BURK|nr:hypothetical protein [Massilia violaceinigra]ATQ77763.1 hypothetical protein CR152_27135 [Massilia violaceinigra]